MGNPLDIPARPFADILTIPANATGVDHERRSFRDPQGNAVDGGSELRSGPQDFEKFLTSAHATAGSLEERGAPARAGAKDISNKAIAYAEKNVQASLDYAQSLLKATDLTEVMRLHSEYVQGQMRSLAEQASEMGQIVSKAAMEAAKPKS